MGLQLKKIGQIPASLGGSVAPVSLFQNMASRLISAKNMATYFAAASRLHSHLINISWIVG